MWALWHNTEITKAQKQLLDGILDSLLSASSSAENWEASKHAKYSRLCDKKTREEVSKVYIENVPVSYPN